MEFTKDIKFNRNPIANQTLDITYSGFLSDSEELSIVYGFGESWEHTCETSMKKINGGFTTQINILNSDILNFCFKNSNNCWDNNCNCNYVTSIFPNTTSNFDIDALIEELLQPIVSNPQNIVEDTTPIQINTQPIDLGVEITRVLSEIDYDTSTTDLADFSLDEILLGTVIDETPIELFEETNIENNFDETLEEKSLINIEDSFIISPRQLNKFYLWRKRVKLAFYKALVKIPKLIFGSEEQ